MAETPQTNATKPVLIASPIIDFGLGAMKVVVGFFANSHALIADGIHSLSDLATDLMVLFLHRLGAEEPDDEHPYGHDRFETLGSLVLGSILLFVAGLILYDSILRLMAQQTIEIPTWPALAVAFISILVNEGLYQWTRIVGQRAGSNLLLANAWHHRSDALSSIVVLVGIGSAMAGFVWMEMVAAIFVSFMIALVAWRLLKASVEELVDTALSETQVEEIRATAVAAEGVRGIHNLRSRLMGNAILLDIHLQVDKTISVSEGHHIGDWVTARLMQKFSDIRDITIHIDTYEDDDAVDTTLPLRSTVREELARAWNGLISPSEISRLVLHYNDRSIDVEVFLEQATDDKAALQASLKAACNHLAWLEGVEVWH